MEATASNQFGRGGDGQSQHPGGLSGQARPDSASRSPTRNASHQVQKVLLTDEEGAKLWGIGERSFIELQKEPWFPKPVLLGPRLKRHVLHELVLAVQHMPRQAGACEPAQLRRGKIEAMKARGVPA